MMDRHATHCLYLPNGAKKKEEFIQATNAVPRVVHAKDNNGHEIVSESKGNVYARSSLFFNFENLTKKNIVEFVNETLSPVIFNYVEDDYASKIKQQDLPCFQIKQEDKPSEYNVVDTWDKAFSNYRDIQAAATFILKEEHGQTIREWIATDPKHISQYNTQ